ncbi:MULTISPECIES: MFS transporter [unclassified Burkholderia]|uniref:MFS transporter n=1 Tax=unclassified Burkholderia TaxID=2613784 RepID=UPI000F56BA4E|nr:MULTISPECIES: MFS transporter [unclassified Burkholderia]RQR30748.1 MFS transporter [Burkholderia sp. Bp9142]RQR45968.1 MFS transporter [Burkholderia sp. Bp9140]
MEIATDDGTSKGIYIRNVLGAALGMAFGFAAIFIATSGVFSPAIVKEFHWGRAQAAQSYSASMLGLAFVSPLIGVLMDRFGVKRVVFVSAIVFAIAMACMASQKGNTVSWVALSLIVGMSGAATSVLGYLAILPQWFDRRLGLAIGIAMVGFGIGTVAMPALSARLIAHVGWREAYQVLAIVSCAGAFVAFLLMREKRGSRRVVHVRGTSGAVDAGVGSTRGRRVKVLMIFAGALCASTAVLSLVPHLPALLMDRGISAIDAARCASFVGFGILIGRLTSGLLVDRIHAPFVACVYFASGAIGFVLLRQIDSYYGAMAASILVGLAIGAEGDLLSYLTRAYIGMEKFGLFYGIVFSGYSLGAVIGPMATGYYFDVNKSYDLPMQMAPYLLLASCVFLLGLGRYTKPGEHSNDSLSRFAVTGK